jgi:hypothetical protein
MTDDRVKSKSVRSSPDWKQTATVEEQSFDSSGLNDYPDCHAIEDFFQRKLVEQFLNLRDERTAVLFQN